MLYRQALVAAQGLASAVEIILTLLLRLRRKAVVLWRNQSIPRGVYVSSVCGV